MNKKRALICSIIFFSLSLISFIVFLAGLNFFTSKIIGLLTVMFVMFLLGGFIMLFVYSHLKKKEVINPINTDVSRPSYNGNEFIQWLQKFEPFVRTGAKLTETSDKTFTKFGGLPIVPEDFKWVTYNNHPIPFLLQIDFSEINADGSLGGFPKEGLLYLFVESDDINDPTFEDGEEEYSQGRTFQFRFFDKPDKLVTAAKPDALEIIYKEFHVTPDIIKTYPDPDECKEAFEIYCDRPVGGMDDEYDDLQGVNMEAFLIGGWATYIQCSRFADDHKLNPDDWVLLMQIASVADDENFMWGDSGNLYFYIKKEDLLARKFDNIKLDMQCY